VGVGHRPKSLSGGDEAGRRTGSGLDGIEQYGRGEKDPVTGLYDWYDLPEGHEAHAGQGKEVRLVDLFEQWPLLVADFADCHIRLHRERDSLTWAEFKDVLVGLLQSDSRLRRHFTRDDEPEVGDEW
jgi:hypothetical protein